MTEPAYIAFFDLDGTILDTSSGKLYIKYMFRNRRISIRELLEGSVVGLVHRMAIMDTENQVRKWVMRYKGRPEEETLATVSQWFETDVKSHIREKIVREIEDHRAAGARLVILSAATNYICDIVKAHLSMDDVICTRLGVKNGRFTGRLADSYCYGKEKLIRALSYCQDNGCALNQAFYYGDSPADAYIMEQAGTSVCVSPDRRLTRLARAKGWRIIDD